MIAAQQPHSDVHKLIWICSAIGAAGGASGVFYGVIKWMAAIYKKAGETLSDIAETKRNVDVLTTNHMAHVQTGVEQLNEKTDESNRLLSKINEGIVILVDRTPRT
jgi:hypothetical protein